MIIAVNFPFLAIGKKKPEKKKKKNQGFNGIRTRDLLVTGALLSYQYRKRKVPCTVSDRFTQL